MLNTNLELKSLTEETIGRLRAVTNDPIDAMRLAADLYAMNAYLAERAIAIETGVAPPTPPKMLSAYMAAFATNIQAKLVEMARLLTAEERRRLSALGPSLAAQLETDDGDLGQCLALLLAMHPGDAVLWVRAYLDDIEKRFAS